MNLVRQFTEAIRSAQATKTSAYDTSATVTRIEGSTAWVHIPGGVDETPVKLTIDAKAGDTVQVRVGGGKAWLTGNATAPPTDDTKALQVADSVGEVTKVVKAVEGVASKASKIATNLNQYFWFVESGDSGENGAHITQVPADDFLADPSTGGGNLLATSSGIAIRDGQTDMAVFSADGLQVYSDTDTQVEIAHLGYGEGTDRDGTTSDAPYYTLGVRPSSSTIGNYSVAEGYQNRASAFGAHAEGYLNTASGMYSHAEGASCQASGFASHAEGSGCKATGDYSHAEGHSTIASGDYSHASGMFTTAGPLQTVVGINNVEDEDGIYYFIVGNGGDESSNAFAVRADGLFDIGASPFTASSGSTTSLATGTNVTVASVTLDYGYYLLIGNCRFASNSSGRRNVHFSTTDGGSDASRTASVAVAGSGDGVTILQTTWATQVTSDNTTLYLVAYQDSGSTINATYPSITAVRLG